MSSKGYVITFHMRIISFAVPKNTAHALVPQTGNQSEKDNVGFCFGLDFIQFGHNWFGRVGCMV